MKFLVAKGLQTTTLVWDTPKTQILHHKDLSKHSYVDTLKGSLRREDNKEKMIPLKTVPHKHKSTFPTKVKNDRKNKITRRNPLINIYLLDIVTLAIILVIRQYNANLMDNTIT